MVWDTLLKGTRNCLQLLHREARTVMYLQVDQQSIFKIAQVLQLRENLRNLGQQPHRKKVMNEKDCRISHRFFNAASLLPTSSSSFLSVEKANEVGGVWHVGTQQELQKFLPDSFEV